MLSKQGIVELLKNNDRAIARALVVLNQRQTADEQATEDTRHRNGQGFRPCHARMGTSMAKFFERRGFLTDKQVSYWRRPMKDGKMKIEIYAGQLLEVAESRAAAKNQPGSYAASSAAANNMVRVNGEFERVSPQEDVGNLLEQRMVLQEMLESGDPTGEIKAQLEQIDNAVSAAYRAV